MVSGVLTPFSSVEYVCSQNGSEKRTRRDFSIKKHYFCVFCGFRRSNDQGPWAVDRESRRTRGARGFDRPSGRVAHAVGSVRATIPRGHMARAERLARTASTGDMWRAGSGAMWFRALPEWRHVASGFRALMHGESGHPKLGIWPEV